MSNGRVLVTGCAGYVGSILCGRLLDDGFEVLGVDSLAYGNGQALSHLLGARGFEFFRKDVRDSEGLRPLLRRADAIVPLAAVVGAPACDKHPGWARETNLDAVGDMLAMLSPAQRVVFPNTNSGYGQTEGLRPVTEQDPLTPVSAYGRQKAEAEKMVLDHASSASLRLATVFGASPRMRFDLLVNDFTARLKLEGRLEVYEPHHRRNFIHVRDAARAFRKLLIHGHLRGAYNAGLPDANLTKLELANLVAGTLGLFPPQVTVGKGTDPDQRNYLVSNDRLLGTGFEFLHTLGDGIREVAQLVDVLPAGSARLMRNA